MVASEGDVAGGEGKRAALMRAARADERQDGRVRFLVRAAGWFEQRAVDERCSAEDVVVTDRSTGVRRRVGQVECGADRGEGCAVGGIDDDRVAGGAVSGDDGQADAGAHLSSLRPATSRRRNGSAPVDNALAGARTGALVRLW